MATALLNMVVAFFALFPSQVTAAQQSGRTTDWPSLRFYFTLKRNSMKIYGHSNFSMYANPIVSHNADQILYEVFATLTEGTTLHKYTLFDGFAYTSYSDNPADDSTNLHSVSCLNSESGEFPAINSIISAINEATTVSSSSRDYSLNCGSGNLFNVSLRGIDFALCTLGSSGFIMQGSDMDINVEFLASHIDIQVPTVASSKECKKVLSPYFVSPIGKSLLTGQSFSDNARNLRAATSFLFRDKPSCSCKSIPRPCVFIHGFGVKEERPVNQDTAIAYWGHQLAGHGPCCSSMKFAQLNTVITTWTSDELQDKVCDRILAVSNTSKDSIISDTIVVTHSMGSLMFAGALSNGKCRLDSSSTWVSMAAPMLGSMCSDFLQDSCAGKTTFLWKLFAEFIGRCPSSTALMSMASVTGSYSSLEMNASYAAAQEVHRRNVFALMCSKSYSGVTSMYRIVFWWLGTSVPHKSEYNDGMVEFQSCATGFSQSKFGDNYRDRFYATRLNHYDMQFKSGDSLLDETKMPLKWFDCLL